jgi:thiol:disulfide interchange protein DsbD
VRPIIPRGRDGTIRLATVAASLWWSGRALAADATPDGPSGKAAHASDQVTVELIAEHGSIQPGGKTRVGVQFDIEDGWHIYGREPGDAGLPTTVSWSVPAGMRVGPLQYPKPQPFLDPGDIRTFGYTGAVVLHSSLTHQTGRDRYAEIPVQAAVKWLACKELCVPGSATLSLTLPVSPTPPVFSSHAQLFDQLPE